MNSIELHRKIIDRDILVSIVKTEAGIQLIATGGDKSHIGAITIVDPYGKDTTICFPHHREDVITKKWSKKIYERTKQPVVVSSGIHFDNASKEMITEIVAESDKMLDEICHILFLSYIA